MDATTRAALRRSQVIDMTTTGRRSGEARRIEIFLHSLDGRLVITGIPRPGHTRAWIHNVAADEAIVIHLKDGLTVDLPATARVVTDPAERLALLEGAARNWGRTDLDVMVEHSPLIEVTMPGFPV